MSPVKQDMVAIGRRDFFGENMRNAGKIKLGYYPLPGAEGSRLRRLLNFPTEGASVLDPCVGTAAALNQLTERAVVSRYGVELDADRALKASDAGVETIHGNIFDTHAKIESFSLLYLNPPYDFEVGSFCNKRMEFLFLQRTCRWLIPGGILVMVIPHGRLQDCVPLLAETFTRFQLLRLTDPESERFDQVVLLAVRARLNAASYELNRQKLIETMWKKPLAPLTGEEAAYEVPPSPPAQMVYRGLPLDRLEDLVIASSAWKKVQPFLLPKEETTVGRPITPLHGGHVGLLCTAGLLNGVFGQGQDRHIARWRTVKYVTTFEEKVDGYTEVHKRERFSNELALVYEDGRTLVLTDEMKKEKKDAERTSADRAA